MKDTESLPELFFFYDPQMRKMIYTSQPWENFFDQSPEVKENLPLFNQEAGSGEITDHWQKCLQLKEKQTHHFEYTTNTGQNKKGVYSFLVRGTRIEQVPGEPVWLAGEIKKQDQESAAKTIDKNEDPYRQAYQEFIDIASHDLDAPLRKLGVLVDSALQKMQKQDPAEELQATIYRIHRCLDDMRSLVDDLGVLSRMELEKGQNTTFDLGQLIEETESELDPVIREKKARIQIELMPAIRANRSQIYILIRCLLENALRFSRKDQTPVITIRPRTGETVEGAKFTGVEINDNGIGFEAGEAERIFRPFVRLHGKSAFPGNGIGLALCKKIVDNHRGNIYAEINEDQGARFIFTIPQTTE
ncbi:MAG TPA: ATP-binding protein [Chitinophagaceae bacterium]|nr:ATP-binding protein [Chitinophagaceae bacterium]